MVYKRSFRVTYICEVYFCRVLISFKSFEYWYYIENAILNVLDINYLLLYATSYWLTGVTCQASLYHLNNADP